MDNFCVLHSELNGKVCPPPADAACQLGKMCSVYAVDPSFGESVDPAWVGVADTDVVGAINCGAGAIIVAVFAPTSHEVLRISPRRLRRADGMEVGEELGDTPAGVDHGRFDKSEPEQDERGESVKECPEGASEWAGHEGLDTGEG